MAKRDGVYDLVVVGGGSAGLTGARFAARLGRKVAIVEANRLGGDCTWTGCVPSKSLIRAANLAHDMRQAGSFGLASAEFTVNFRALMDRVRSVIAEIHSGESPEILKSQGIDTFLSPAKFKDPHTVNAGNSNLVGKKFLLATGARPSVPPITGLDRVPFLTYESLWNLEELPDRLLIIGGGAIGCEFAQAFARLGSSVTLFEGTESLLGQEEPEATGLLADALKSEGVCLQLATLVDSVYESEIGIGVTSKGRHWTGDSLLVATGRRPNVDGMDLEKAGITQTDLGITVDCFLRTTRHHIFAAGDCTGGPQFTHYAAWQGFMATRNALLPGKAPGTLASVPRVTFTDPELAQAGLTEREAKDRHGDAVRTVLWPYGSVDRAVIDGTTAGFIKAVTLNSGRLAGATIVGPGAGEMIHEWALAIDRRTKLGELANTLHAYPTYSMATLQMATEQRVSQLLSGSSGKLIRTLLRVTR